MCKSTTICAQLRLVARYLATVVDDSHFIFVIKPIVVTQNKPDTLAAGLTRLAALRQPGCAAKYP